MEDTKLSHTVIDRFPCNTDHRKFLLIVELNLKSNYSRSEHVAVPLSPGRNMDYYKVINVTTSNGGFQ